MAVKHKDLKKVVSELEGAVKAHGRQAKTIKQHIKDMSGPFKMSGFSYPGQSPMYKKNKEGKEQGVDGKACWDGYRYAGTEGGSDKCVEM